MTFADGAYSLRVVCRDAIHTNPVVARTHRDHRHGNLLDGCCLLNEQTIDNLMQRAVTTDDDDATIALIYGLHGKLGYMVLMLREDQLVRNLVVADEFCDMRQIDKPATKASHGIDDYIPFIVYFSLH